MKVWGAYNTSLIPGRWVPAEATFMVTDNYEVSLCSFGQASVGTGSGLWGPCLP